MSATAGERLVHRAKEKGALTTWLELTLCPLVQCPTCPTIPANPDYGIGEEEGREKEGESNFTGIQSTIYP